MKKKILSIALVVIIALVALAGASLAYLTNTKTQVNTFTAGNVEIKLDEAEVVLDADGYISTLSGNRVTGNQFYGKLYPGQEITKDPTITNVGSEKAYVAAKVTVKAPNLEGLIGTNYHGLLGINEIISGGLVKENDTMKTNHPLCQTLPVYGDDTYSIYQVKESDGVHVFYIFIETIMNPGDVVVLFETLTIPGEWDHAQIEMITGLEITVEAYATQIQTFDDCLDAMTTAFPGAFDFE